MMFAESSETQLCELVYSMTVIFIAKYMMAIPNIDYASVF